MGAGDERRAQRQHRLHRARADARGFVGGGARARGIRRRGAHDGAGYFLPGGSATGYSVDNVAASLAPVSVTPGPTPPVSYLGHFTPNPLRASGVVEYGLARGGDVTLEIYDLAGRRVRELVHGPVEAGTWHARWNARDDRGRPVRAGVYLVRFVGGGVERSGKIVVAQ